MHGQRCGRTDPRHRALRHNVLKGIVRGGLRGIGLGSKVRHDEWSGALATVQQGLQVALELVGRMHCLRLDVRGHSERPACDKVGKGVPKRHARGAERKGRGRRASAARRGGGGSSSSSMSSSSFDWKSGVIDDDEEKGDKFHTCKCGHRATFVVFVTHRAVRSTRTPGLPQKKELLGALGTSLRRRPINSRRCVSCVQPTHQVTQF